MKRLDLSVELEVSSDSDRLLEATLPQAGAHREGDTRIVETLLEAQPALAGANIWVACATGELDAVREFLETDRALATLEGGTRGWDPLLYLAFSRLLRTDDACAARMLEIAGMLLDAGADPNTSWCDPAEAEGNRETPLYAAAGVAGRVELARLLIERGADPNDGETAYHMVEHDGVPCAEFIFPKLQPLHRGMALGHKLDYDDFAGVKKLLELGADPNGPTPFGKWPIHQAVWRGRERRFFDLLLEHGAQVDKADAEGRTAYAIAARSGKSEIMQWLVEAGASVTLGPVDAFIASCAAGDPVRAKALLDAQPDLTQKFSKRDRAEICEAAASGNARGVESMIALGWDVNTRGAVWSETPAHRAAMDGQLEALRVCVQRGSDLTLLDASYHCTPLGWAQHGGQKEIIEYLRGFPERLDLWDAIELGLVERAKALIADTDPNAALRGANPGVYLRLAAYARQPEIVECLLQKGADPSLAGEQGVRAIDIARERGDTAIVELLQKNPD